MQYFIDGLSLLFSPGVKRFVFIPLLINIVLFIALFYTLRHFTAEFNAWFTQFLPAWLQWLSLIFWLLFFASFFLLIIFAFVTIANLIAAPFNSLLSEKVEYILTGALLPARSTLAVITDIPRMIGRQFAIIFYYLPRALGLLILFFIPLIQVSAPFLWFFFNAWFMVLTYYDYPSDNHRQSFANMRVTLAQQRMRSLGFGTIVLLISMVPVLNLLVIPAAVAGATKLWSETKK